MQVPGPQPIMWGGGPMAGHLTVYQAYAGSNPVHPATLTECERQHPDLVSQYVPVQVGSLAPVVLAEFV